MTPESIFAWLRDHETLLWWLGASSVILFVGTLMAVPFLVARIPVDYITRSQHAPPRRAHPVWHAIVLVVRNIFGGIFLLAGLAMLVLPGQGILTILIGLSLMTFPGKQALEHRIMRQSAVLQAINWMRARAGAPPLQPPEEDKH